MKVTLEQIESKIKNTTYLVLPDGRTTLCTLTLENGYTIQGLSACVDISNFDLQLGRKYAREDAVRQIWPLEGYLLAEKMHYNRGQPAPLATFGSAPVKAEGQPVSYTVNVAKPVLKPRKVAAPYGLKKDGTPKSKPGRKV